MSHRDSVVVSVDVGVTPDIAFRIFTEEIDRWYRKDRNTLYDVERALRLEFEPFSGGRLLEVYDEDQCDVRELARVVDWEPGRLLAFRDNHGTDVKVRFISSASGTRVTLEHSGFERVPEPERGIVRQYGWTIVLAWFEDYSCRTLRFQ